MNTINGQTTPLHHNRPITYDLKYPGNGSGFPLIIFVHGFKSYKDWGAYNLVSNYFVQKGFAFLKFNLSHNGTIPEKMSEFADLEAFGRNNFSIEMGDLKHIIDRAQEGSIVEKGVEFDLERLFLIGHSRGGGLCLMKTAEDYRVKKLVTWAAISSVGKNWSKEALNQWKEKGVTYIHNARTGQDMPLYYQIVEDYYNYEERFNIESIAPKIKAPTLLIQGDADETVPYSSVEALLSWNPSFNHILVPNAGHTFGAKEPWEYNYLPDDLHKVLDDTIEFLI